MINRNRHTIIRYERPGPTRPVVRFVTCHEHAAADRIAKLWASGATRVTVRYGNEPFTEVRPS